MSLKNLTADSLLVVVEAGKKTQLKEDRYQDIIITREEFITLRKTEEKNLM